MDDHSCVRVERQGDVAIVTMDRPRKRNALNREMAAALTEAVRSSHDAAAVVLTGSDPAFCAGLDLSEATKTGFIDDTWLAATFVDCPTPIIAAVNGPAVTAGLEIALACDFIVASDRASFADTHALVGTVPGGGMTVRLAQRTSPGFARQMSFTGNFVDATTARRAGLVNYVYPHDELISNAVGIATQMARVSPDVLRMVKRMYNETSSLQTNGALPRERALFEEFTSDHAAGFAEFLEDVRDRPREP